MADLSSDVLLAGEGALAAPDAPAELVVDLERLAARGVDHLTVAITPLAVAREEAYIVVATARAPGLEEPREIGWFAFFPPAREGATREMVLDLATLPEEGRAHVLLRLVPVSDDTPLAASRLRVDGARLPER